MPESPAVQAIRGISVEEAEMERVAVPTVAMNVNRHVTPYILKTWKRTWNAARKEAERQARSAYPGCVIEATGRTFHSESDWAFEFVVRGKDVT